MQPKKGQIAVFLILSIIIVSTAFAGFYIWQQKHSIQEQQSSAGYEMMTVKPLVDNCIQEIAGEALVSIGRTGGYYMIPDSKAEFLGTDIALYLDNDRIATPSKTTIEHEIGEYIDKGMPACLMNLSTLEEKGIAINWENSTTKVRIAMAKVIFDVSLPLTIKMVEKETRIDSFPYELKGFRIGQIYDIAKSMTDMQSNDPDSFCLSCAINLTSDKNMTIDMSYGPGNIIVLTIRDPSSQIDDAPYRFSWAYRFKGISCDSIPSDMPFSQPYLKNCLENEIGGGYDFSIEKVDNLTAKAGKQFNYTIKAAGYNVTFKDFTGLFDIDPGTGKIGFVPSKADTGNHTIWIMARDRFGNELHDSFILRIVE
jgi:hypothetical protein